MIVLDASALLEYLLRTELGIRSVARRVLAPGRTVHAPHLIDLEVASALRRQVQAREMAQQRAAAALDDLRQLDLIRYPHVQLLDRIWQLRGNLSAYDAAYIALAEALEAVLVTTDSGLARTHGHRAQIDLVESGG